MLWRITTALVAGSIAAPAAETAKPGLEPRFTETVRPFLKTYCIGCHSGEKPAAQLNLSSYATMASVVQDHGHWAAILEKLTAKEMPPKQATQPPPESRQKVIDWIDAMRKQEARKNAGDPGVVLARRLSNAEYNYTIRDLTGQDIRPTREFPVDPANPAGFDNSGESLSMSPALLNKYLQAAREVADHMVLKPYDLAFAPHLMLVETDRDKYCVNQIVDFYRRQATDYSDYFQAAWRFKHRTALGKPKATLAGIAAGDKISSKYLATIWRTLEETKEEAGPGAKLQAMWRALPVPTGNQPNLAKEGSDRMRDYVVQLRKKIEPRFSDLTVGRLRGTSQPFHMWKNRQYATHRMTYDRAALQVEGEAKPVPSAGPAKPATDNDADDDAPAASASRPQGADPDLFVPAGQRERYEVAFARFSAVFPDNFYIRERGRYYLDPTRDKGRHLSAGFHNLMGYFRDDIPLYELILDEKGQKELDALWRELDFVASANIRTFTQFYLNESGEARGTSRESEGARPGEKAITSEEVIMQTRESYLNRVRPSGNAVAAKAIEDHFQWVNEGIRWVEKARLEAEPRHLEALLKFAGRAYRRPLTPAERENLLTYYRLLREKSGLTHEDALRDSVVSVLMSPDFCYRIDLVEAGGNVAAKASSATGAKPLSDYALASRLSYFLWSSMPDDELLARATAGELRNQAVLAAQARRMLKNARAQGLAIEFGGNWLDFRRFEELNTVDRDRFPAFTNDLRQAMFEEPIRFTLDLIQSNRSVLDFLFANHTFVNPLLAKHYGMPDVSARPDEWVRVDDARRYGRGGLLAMSAFLTKNAPGLRTSPVKRGYWVVRKVLGEEIPPPPAMVPELPQDEAKLELPLREMLAKHREDPSCSGCHARFDSFGLAFEGYGPIGERRTKDLAGHPVDAKAPFAGGTEATGFEGVQNYIRAHREKDFVESLCRKMLIYALGRGLLLSDEPLIEKMQARLAVNGYRFSSVVETIVTSPQFLTKKGS